MNGFHFTDGFHYAPEVNKLSILLTALHIFY